MDGIMSCMITLSRSNWKIWKTRMEDLLYCKDLHAPLKGDEAKPKDMMWGERVKSYR